MDRTWHYTTTDEFFQFSAAARSAMVGASEEISYDVLREVNFSDSFWAEGMTFDQLLTTRPGNALRTLEEILAWYHSGQCPAGLLPSTYLLQAIMIGHGEIDDQLTNAARTQALADPLYLKVKSILSRMPIIKQPELVKSAIGSSRSDNPVDCDEDHIVRGLD